jgi:polar amino acid transport system substrate-binding protein
MQSNKTNGWFTYVLMLCSMYLLSVKAHGEEPKQESVLLRYDLGQQGGWIPYQQSAQRGKLGIFEEVTLLIQELTGIEFEAVHFPPKRAEKALLDGLVDFDFVCLEWLKEGRSSAQFVYSNPIFNVSEYVVTLPENAAAVPDRSAIYNKPVGTIAGYFYVDDDQFSRMDFLNEELLLLGLKHQRFTSIIIEKETAKYWAKLLDIEISFAAAHTLGSIIIRLRDDKREWLPIINQAIETIKESGQLASLLEKHGIKAEIPATQQSK